jgi:dynein heavy chain
MADNDGDDNIDEMQSNPRLDSLIGRLAYALVGPDGNVESFIRDMKPPTTTKEHTSFVGKLRELTNEDTKVDHFFVIQKDRTYMLEKEIKEKEQTKAFKKCILFLNLPPGHLTEHSIPKLVHFEIAANNPLKYIHDLATEVYVPILQNSNNQKGWTDLISKDLMEKLNNFNATMYLTLGQVHGKTQLPLPPKKIIDSNEISSKDKADIFNNSIITWMKQIRKVLDTEPEQSLKAGNDPGPKVEIAFWKKKSENLNSIYEQLKSSQVENILRTLRDSKSTYANEFDKQRLLIKKARDEANDNFMYLRTLEGYFDQLDKRDFTKLPELFMPVMKVILLIWERSTYYNKASRLVVLIREICNAIIAKALYHVPSDEIIRSIQDKETVQDACKKLQTTIDVCAKFKDSFFHFKSLSKNSNNGQGWGLPMNALFIRLDSFLERCHDIMHITDTIVQFNKLDAINIGGTKGKNLSSTIQQISHEFKAAVEKFKEGPNAGEGEGNEDDALEIMDINNKAFDDSFFEFRNTIKELERRLAAVITQSFDDTDTLSDKFRLLDSFDDLLKRPIIQDELEKKHIVLIETYKRDLKAVQEVFVTYSKPIAEKVDERVIYKNMPPVAGALNWTKSLRGRISEPFEKLKNISPDIKDKEEFQDVSKMKAAIEKKLNDHEQRMLLDWRTKEGEKALSFLENTLLVRDESNGTLRVNFELQLVSLLREVKYLKMLEDKEIPLDAEKVYSKSETLRRQVNKLDQIVEKYNFVVTKLEVVEEPLIASKIEKMNESLRPGIDEIRWKSPDVDSFISSVNKQINEVYEIVESMKNDLEKIRQTLDNLNSESRQILERKVRPIAPEDFLNEHNGFHKQQTDKIKKEGGSITKKIKDITDKIIGSGNAQSASAFKKQKEYKDYQEFINDIVIDGLSKAICTSLEALNQLIEIKNTKKGASNPPDYKPLFGVELDVRGESIEFDPEIGNVKNSKSIKNIIQKVVSDYVSYACCIPRIDTNAGDYMNEMHDNFEIRSNLAGINENINKIVDRAETKKNQYEPYKMLWSSNPEEAFKLFLTKEVSARTKLELEDPTYDDPDKINPIMEGITTKIPPFETFDDRIQDLKKIKKEVLHLQSIEDIEWLRINTGPLKNSLENKADYWINMYTNFFLNQVKRFLKNCDEFRKYLEEGTKKDPSQHPEDTALLRKTMEVLGKERIVISRLSNNIDFVKKMIKALKDNDVEMKLDTSKQQEGKGDDFNAMVDSIDTTLREISNTKIYAIKTAILPLKQKETANLKDQILKFSEEISQFKVEFQKTAPMDYYKEISIKEIEDSYDKLDEYFVKLQDFRKRAKEFGALEQLFELEPTKYRAISDCQTDIEKLKIFWDVVAVIKYTYSSWMRIPWKKIEASIQSFGEENQKFQELLKKQSREVKLFRGYNPLKEEVDNMKKIISSIASLQATKLTKRHWNDLSEVVKSTLEENNPSFCYESMVKVEIHKYENQVLDLCEQAEKENKIGKTLNDISKAWKERTFLFEPFMVSGEEVKIFRQFDEIQNDLSADNLKVLGLLSQGKSVEIFAVQLNELKQKLGYIDECVVVWEKVQKNWKRLVNIFMLSEDIRSQLPEATKIFEQKNNEFRGIMADAAMTQVMYEICTPEKKEELDGILKAIESCEKQLNQYLEQKKKIFPRFYFVSNQTLIDILSNGNNPAKIATEYLGDLFDGLKKLVLAKAKEGDVTIKAEAMRSKDDELVKFDTPFEPSDAVEQWLLKLEFKMRETLENYLLDAKEKADSVMKNPAVDEKHKMDWISAYCSQISLLVTQIVWTEDVHQAFDDIEGGMSNAMKECLVGIKVRIESLIDKVRGFLTPDERNKIITIITIDVHSRDAVEKLCIQNINDKENFQWGSQLKFFLNNYNDIQDIIQKGQKQRFPWEERKDRNKAVIRIVDWARFYSYEYVGNCGRLVITPLTDRCYITLTQALGLCMGGAPAGPAGTGKTETTKDLGRAIGLAVFVFNCSEQMSTDSLGQNFMGLSQTGAWGCFDEFNRISIEVLSVVSTQVKQIQDALKTLLRTKEDKFNFMGEDDITLQDTVGLFITMNPGYAGRTELPESLKALFRSCAMVVPDLVLICENMLMSEGYKEAKELAKKFVTIYMLSRSLLSKQKHYDWGLRAVKSVLRQAGKLKRDEKNANLTENQLLMRALRDFNLPKIYSEDKPIFLNLIQDLFKKISVDSVTNESLDESVVKVAKHNKLIADISGSFSLKCVQLAEILEVRHCVFVIGPPGCGKSTVWKTLSATFKDRGEDTERDCLDPKAVTSDELFGVLTKTKEFKNGVLSSIIRNQSKELAKYKVHHKHKWAVLDGDIDPEWIESLNTVMDDNKVLTLVSNDRFPMSASMRLIFEISNLRNATPATVSRAGVLFINESDIGWNPFFESWLNGHKEERDSKGKKIPKDPMSRIADFDDKAISVFTSCFGPLQSKGDKSEMMSKFNRISPMVEIAMIQTTCAIIDELVWENQAFLSKLTNENDKKQVYEGIFYFASMWAFGGPIQYDTADEKRSYQEFNNQWKARAKIPDIRLEGVGGENQSKPIYDFEYDVQNLQWKEWDVEPLKMQEEDNFLRIFVDTVASVRLKRLIELHVAKKKPILLVGSAGTGKTAVVNKYLKSIQNSDTLMTYNTNFSSKTSSASLQENIMNSGIGKLGTRFYGLSGKTLVFFIDDLNMPYVDKYGTQSPIALLRQIIDYNLVYDRDNLEEYITLQDLYFCGCLNPKAGSFTIEPRLQRHFSLFAVQTPDETVIKQIYKQILEGHFSSWRFPSLPATVDLPAKLVDATYNIFYRILQNGKVFSPTAQKFHYQFNLRDISRITEGLLLSTQINFNDKAFEIFKLWVHECRRVFEDRLLNEDDIKAFRTLLEKTFDEILVSETPFIKPNFKEDAMSSNNIFTSFISVWEVMDDKFYLPIKSKDQLNKCLHEKLAEYNESNSQMNLVLFAEAVLHICKIARIIERPAGNALLIGVGGSGKQSLTKLAAFLHSHELDIIKVTSSFSVADFKLGLIQMFKKVTKPPGVAKTILATDAQLSNENILIYLNEILNSGYIAGLWEKLEFEAHLQTLRNEAKNSGFTDSLYLYFVEKIRKNLHVCLCMSPVGDTLRVRARKFPGIVNQCQIDWFHSWPESALFDVAYSFLKDMPLPDQVESLEGDIRRSLSENMAETHISIDLINKEFLYKERRYNYTTPKSFLELIEFYKANYVKNNEKIETQIISLQKSLEVLKKTHERVEDLKKDLIVIGREVEEKSKKTNELLAIVNADKKEAEEEEAKAKIEAAKTNEIKEKAENMAAQSAEKFLLAKPMLDRAVKALENLNDKDITDMKSYPKPTPPVLLCGRTLLYLLDRKKGVDLYKDAGAEKDWPDVQKMMNNAKKFKVELLEFSEGEAKVMENKKKDYMRKLLADPKFAKEAMDKVSKAASGLSEFVHSIVNFSDAFQIVAPLEKMSKEANEKKDESIKALEIVISKVNAIKAKVADLEAKLELAMQEKRLVEEKRNFNLQKMQNAEELVNGLSTNQIRWSQNLARLQSETLTNIGDSLLAAEFVSYIGPFSSYFRKKLWHETWLPKITDKKIPITTGIEPMTILTNSDTIAKWKNEGLPEDQMSCENAAIITSSNRWPLIIDPQLQGGIWISGHVANPENFKKTFVPEPKEGEKEDAGGPIDTGEQLLRISLNADKWEVKLEEAITNGRIVLLENVTQDIDPILDPLLSRGFSYKKGGSRPYIMFTKDDAIAYNPDFRLFLQCKLSNPHFKPETAAQCSIINFIVTENGLEDQLLAVVVDIEKPELERKKMEVMRSMNQNAVDLIKLDNKLLLDLSKANPDTILEDTELIGTLNFTKDTSKKIEKDTEEAKITEKQINEERNNYRPVAAEGAMLYFLIISLNAVNHMYQYSLESFQTFFDKGIMMTPKEEKGAERIQKMVLIIRERVYQWISRGLFERHKVIFLTMLTFRLMTKRLLNVEFTDKELKFLLTCIPKIGIENPVKDWLKGPSWGNALKLAELNGFEKLPESIGNELAARFKEWYSDENPEITNLPPAWKFVNQQPFKKLLVLRALRPDRMIPALSNFIRDVLPNGEAFVNMDQSSSFAQILKSAYTDGKQETALNTPIFFILSPGADPVREVEALGEKEGFTVQKNNFFNISLGQGQDIIANAKLEVSYKEGCWIMLQNIHLMPSWLGTFEKILDRFTKEGGANDRFRLFLSAEPNDYIPIGILEKCIKLTNEPPAGLKANVKRAWNYFNPQETDDKDTKLKAVLFGLCYFHSTLIERRKFGPKGWNMFYPFNIGDLRDSAKVLENSIDPGSGRLPWADFKYIFGEIMYGGHIVDDWDRRLCSAYLENIMVNELLSEEFELLPYTNNRVNFKTPAPNVSHAKFNERIENALGDKETPMYYGLHPNAEINLGTVQCTTLFETLVMLQPQDSSAAVKVDDTSPDKLYEASYIVKVQSDWTLKERMFVLDDIKDKCGDVRTPYQNVFLQECEYMNYLLEEICSSLGQLKKAKEGELTYSEKLEKLETSLNFEKVPDSWADLAYPAKRSLATWFDNLLKRIEQLSTWKDDPTMIPRVTRINLLFNPQSFLTAIKQESKTGEDLNKLMIATDFTKKSIEQIESHAKDGAAYCFGFLLDGAAWDTQTNLLDEARPKEMFSHMPVCLCRAIKSPDMIREDKSIYVCPVYRTEQRGNTYICEAQLRTPPKYDPRKWILAGVAIILDVEGESDEVKQEKDPKK